MSYYRVYIVGQDGHFIDAINLNCADDGAAIESAKQLVDGRDIELWQEGRMVTKLVSSNPAQDDPWPSFSVPTPRS